MKRFLLPLIFLGLCAGKVQAQPQHAQYVWQPSPTSSRFQVAVFRKHLELEQVPEQAEMHLFADSRYILWVNGQSLGFGPARSYPAHPEYDTYDLAPYLQRGNNLIAVQVWSNGTSSFQLRRMPAAFIAWGDIGEQSLHTPGDWRVLPLQGYDAEMVRMSFALGPMERYDARKDPPNWMHPEAQVMDQPVVPLKEQAAWGDLSPRSIPHLTQEVVQPRELVAAFPFKSEEDFYSFRVKVPDQSGADFRKGRWLTGYTYIYSPREQEVEVGLWWGKHFLNGAGPLEQSSAPAHQPHRQTATLDLKQGWNEFFVQSNSFWGKWEFYFAAPKSAELVLSPTKRADSPFWFMTAGPFTEEEEKRLTELELPFAAEQLPKKLSSTWTGKSRNSRAHNPAVEMNWRYADENYAVPAHQIANLTVNDPHGTGLLFDFRYKQLARIVVEYEAPSGTIMDVGFSEDLHNGRAFTAKRHGIYPAARHITGTNSRRFETLKPYGFRYLELHVSENSAPVKIKRVYAIRQVYPFAQIGSFECSDPLMNAIWDIGWRTVEVCAEDSYTDTPFRERGLYAGDMLPQMAITLAGSGDLRLVKRSLRLFQDMYADQFSPDTEKHPDEIGLLEDYPLLTFEALSWYVDRTGELDFARELMPAYEYLVRTQLTKRDESGLLINQQVFIEWTQIEKRQVSNTAYHALLGRVCQGMSRLYEQLGETSKAKEFRSFAGELTTALQGQCWDESQQAFRDGIKDGKLIDHHYPISSAWPMMYGLTTSEQEEPITDHIKASLRDIGTVNRQRLATPYGSFYLLLALAQQKEATAAETFIRKHWGPMVYKHDDTAWENFGDQGIGTLSHAWSGAPTYYLTSQVLGVELGYPGPSDPDEVLIAPLADQIDWAKGTVPHPRGLIEVAWEVKGKQLWVWCEVPEGVNFQVKPRGRLATLALILNGRRVQ